MRTEVMALFRDVADLSPIERDEHYKREGVPDELRQELESLLKFDLSSDSFRGQVASAERSLLDSTKGAEAADTVTRSRAIPERIARFEVTRLLGRGGMGEVYLARDPVIDRQVAVKLLGSGLEDEAARRRLVREARTVGRLRHPNIVTIFEAGEFEDRSYIAMEYVPGETLGNMVRRRAPLTLRRRLELIEGACAGLAYAHRAGVVHLDIKPDNLMLDDDGVVKVLDFGVARVQQGETLATQQIAGTLRYMSPEQIQEKALDRRSDVFSLGCSLFELITYTQAFAGSTNEIVSRITQGSAPRLLDVVPQVDRRLGEIVAMTLARDPGKRYQDLDALRADLAKARAEIDPATDEPEHLLGVASESGRQSAPSATVRSMRMLSEWVRSPRHGVAAGVVLAVIVSVGAIVVFVVPWRLGVESNAAVNGTTAVAPAVEGVRPSAERPREAVTNAPAGAARGNGAATVERAPGGRGEVSIAGPATAAPLPSTPTQAPATSQVIPAVPQLTEPPRSAPAVEPTAPPAERPATAAAPTPAPAQPQPLSESQAIADTLRRYDAAYSARDVAALLQVFPSLGRAQVDQLRRTFDAMTSYEMETRNASINVSSNAATVLATVARRMVPRVGSPVANEVETEFQLQRAGSGWTIVRVTAR